MIKPEFLNARPWKLAAVVVAAVALSACSSDDDNGGDSSVGNINGGGADGQTDGQTDSQALLISGMLTAAEEANADAPDGAGGEFSLRLDEESGEISGDAVVSGLSGGVTVAHLHMGFAGDTGGVVFGLESEDNITWQVPEGTVLEPAQLQAYLNGGTYLNFHTEMNPGGEVRGQVLPEGIDVITTTLSGDQEVPPVQTESTGIGTLTVNRDSGAVWANIRTVTEEVPSAAHIHAGGSSVNGPVLIGLTQDAEDTAFWRTAAGDTLDVDSLAALDTAGLYFNVHTATNPGGEIRGQIGGTVFTVRIENVSTADTLPTSTGSVPVPLSPGAFLVHRESSNPLLEPRSPAGPALEDVAEDGDPSLFPEEVPGSVVFNTPVGASAAGPIFPGDAYEFSFSAAPGDALAFVTMFIQSNDWFYVPSDADNDSIELFDENDMPVSGDFSGAVTLWESGTELDEEPGTGPNQAPRQSAPDTGTEESTGVASLASRGISVTLNGPVIQVTVSHQ